MPELRQQIYPLDVQRPQLLQEAGSIAGAKKFNVLVKISKIDREETVNPKPKSESARKILDRQAQVEETKKEVAKDNGNFVGEEFYIGMSSPYPKANNFLHNKRSGVGTTQFQR